MKEKQEKVGGCEGEKNKKCHGRKKVFAKQKRSKVRKKTHEITC